MTHCWYLRPADPLTAPRQFDILQSTQPAGGRMQLERRKFIALLGGTVVAWPLAVRAQQATMPAIGFLSGSIQGTGLGLSIVAAYKQGLLDTGYVWGKNVMVEERWANAQYDQLPALADDLVRHQVAVIAADTPVAALAAKRATTSIPIVFGLGSDPVRDGLVASLNRPGGNITGATFFSNLLSAKRLDLFHRLVPNATVIAVLLNPKNANVELERHQTEERQRIRSGCNSCRFKLPANVKSMRLLEV